jgi:hypothetical protein
MKAATKVAFIFCEPDWIRPNGLLLLRLMPTELTNITIFIVGLQGYTYVIPKKKSSYDISS